MFRFYPTVLVKVFLAKLCEVDLFDRNDSMIYIVMEME